MSEEDGRARAATDGESPSCTTQNYIGERESRWMASTGEIIHLALGLAAAGDPRGG